MYKKKCYVCKKAFKQDDLLIPLVPYIENEKRGDFTGQAEEFIHVQHFKVLYMRMGSQ